MFFAFVSIECNRKPTNIKSSFVKNGLGYYDNCGEDLYNLRGGTMYGGVIYKGQSYFAGNNSEKRLHSIQNSIHKNVTKQAPILKTGHFKVKGTVIMEPTILVI